MLHEVRSLGQFSPGLLGYIFEETPTLVKIAPFRRLDPTSFKRERVWISRIPGTCTLFSDPPAQLLINRAFWLQKEHVETGVMVAEVSDLVLEYVKMLDAGVALPPDAEEFVRVGLVCDGYENDFLMAASFVQLMFSAGEPSK